MRVSASPIVSERNVGRLRGLSFFVPPWSATLASEWWLLRSSGSSAFWSASTDGLKAACVFRGPGFTLAFWAAIQVFAGCLRVVM